MQFDLYYYANFADSIETMPFDEFRWYHRHLLNKKAEEEEANG